MVPSRRAAPREGSLLPSPLQRRGRGEKEASPHLQSLTDPGHLERTLGAACATLGVGGDPPAPLDRPPVRTELTPVVDEVVFEGHADALLADLVAVEVLPLVSLEEI